MNNPYSRFSLAVFESLDIEEADQTVLANLKQALEAELLDKINTCPGWTGVERVISALNANGHRFEIRKTDNNWLSYFEETNNATRDFWIHVNQEDDLLSLFILYFEKMEVTKAKQRAEMSDEEQIEAALVDEFYDKGLELVKKDTEGASLKAGQRLHLVLYQLETGVNNGGFETYLNNTEGLYLVEAADYLARVGAMQLEAIVRKVITLLPPDLTTGKSGDILKVVNKQRDTLEKLDSRFYDSDDNLAKLVMKYLEIIQNNEGLII